MTAILDSAQDASVAKDDFTNQPLARVRLEGLLDGVHASREALANVDGKLRSYARTFNGMLQDLPANPHLMLLTPAERKELTDSWDVMTEALDGLYGYQTELDYCQQEQIELKEWEALGADQAPDDRRVGRMIHVLLLCQGGGSVWGEAGGRLFGASAPVDGTVAVGEGRVP
ncbi:MAG TPA: hypothetical protein QGF58_22270, partial [Myxococcota bacterium]|nr:hypothetical protein [Myxococcota bacterium]